MNHRVDTPEQLKAVLRGLRRARGLNQTEAGSLIGVSQRRLASIEANPDGTAFDQVTRLVLALGGHVAFEYQRAGDDALGEDKAKLRVTSPRSARSLAKDTW